MNKKISLILAIVFLCNFILPMICNHSYALGPHILVSDDKVSIRGNAMEQNASPGYLTYVEIDFDRESGIYDINTVMNSGNVGEYLILDSSGNVLPVTLYESDNEIKVTSNNQTSVKLNQGESYIIIMLSPEYDNFYNYTDFILNVKKHSGSGKEITYDYSSSNQTYRGNISYDGSPLLGGIDIKDVEHLIN